MKRKEFLLFIMTLGLAMLFVGCGKKESTEVVATQAVEASTEQEVSTGYQIINVSKEYPALVIKDTDLLDSEYAETSVVSVKNETYVTVYGDVYNDGVSTTFFAVRLDDGTKGIIDKKYLDFNVTPEQDYADSLEEVEGGDGEDIADEAADNSIKGAELALETAEAEPVMSYNVIDCDPVTKYTNTASNIRSIPDKSGDLVDTVQLNTELTVTGMTEDGSWSRTERNGLVCFIKSSLLSDSKTEVSVSSSNNANGGTSSDSQPSSSSTNSDTASQIGGNWSFLNDYPTAGDMQVDSGTTGSTTEGQHLGGAQ